MPASDTPRVPLAIRLQHRLLTGLRTACSASAALLRRIDRDRAPDADPAERAYS